MALALLAVYRSLRRALVPLIPIVLATGWAALGLAIAGVPLNPMSATLGALVIAIATEFSVLLAARYEEERGPGVAVGEALRRAYSRTGMAVLASGITAIAGFAVLIATDIRMLRDFGLVTVLDLGVALLGVLLVCPRRWSGRRPGFAPLRRRCCRRRPACAAGAATRDDATTRRASRRPTQRRKPGEPLLALRRARLRVLIVVATANTLQHPRRRHPRRRARPRRGEPLPQFAVPELLGATEGDANVFQDDCETGANPCPADDRRTPACQVDLPEVIRVCDLFDKPLVISFWFTRRRRLPADPGRRRRGRAALRRAASTSSRSTSATTATRRARSSPSAAGGSRSAGTPTARSPTSTGSAAARRSPSPTRAGCSSEARIGTDAALRASSSTADVERLIRESERRAEEDR